jgi:hypothetical protein
MAKPSSCQRCHRVAPLTLAFEFWLCHACRLAGWQPPCGEGKHAWRPGETQWGCERCGATLGHRPLARA